MDDSMDIPNHKKPFLKEYIPVVLLLVVALILRLAGLAERSYFNDELSALYRLRFEGFQALIEHAVRVDAHPAFVQVFLYYWSDLAGTTPFWIRLPFVVAGVLSVWLLFLLANRWFGRSTAWFAASALALLQFPLLYSQLARPYSTGLLFILAGTLFWERLLFSTGSTPRSRFLHSAGMAVSFALAMYNHYFSFFMAGMIGITGLFFLRRKTLLPYLLSGLGAVILFSPHISITITQVSRGGLSLWLPPPNALWLGDHLLYLFNGSWWLAILVLLFSIPFLVRTTRLQQHRDKRKFMLITALWYFIPLAFAYLYSIFINPILQHSILLFAFPFLLMFLFAGFRNDRSHLTLSLASIFPIILLLHLILGARYFTKDHYGDFKKTSGEICQTLKEEKSSAWAVHVNDPWYIRYYLEKECKIPEPLFYSITGSAEATALHRALDTLSAPVIAYAWLRPADPMIPSILRFHYPHLLRYRDYGGQGEFFRFGKYPGNTEIHYPFDTLVLADMRTLEHPMSLSAQDEFLPVFEKALPVKPGKKNILVHCEFKGQETTALKELQLVFTTSSKKSNKTLSWNGLQLSDWKYTDGRYFFTASLPAGFKRNDLLHVYFWNPARDNFNLESLRLMLIISR